MNIVDGVNPNDLGNTRFQLGQWLIRCNTVLASVTHAAAPGVLVARTGFYSPDSGFRWSDSPVPKYVREAAEAKVRKLRRERGIRVAPKAG